MRHLTALAFAAILLAACTTGVDTGVDTAVDTGVDTADSAVDSGSWRSDTAYLDTLSDAAGDLAHMLQAGGADADAVGAGQMTVDEFHRRAVRHSVDAEVLSESLDRTPPARFTDVHRLFVSAVDICAEGFGGAADATRGGTVDGASLRSAGLMIVDCGHVMTESARLAGFTN